MVIYSKNSNVNNAAFGKFLTPIKMVIEHESDLLKKKGGICDQLFNVEKSNRYGETLVLQDEFDAFTRVIEGNGAESDTVTETRSKFIEHIQFMKEFAITAEMMEDANYGLPVEAKRRAENFARAYYKTINTLCEKALMYGASPSMNVFKSNINLCTPDERPLFSDEHHYGTSTEVYYQSNYYWGDIFRRGADRAPSVEAFEESLAALSVKLRNMLDDNGEPLGYTADTIILPGNRPAAEMIAKKVCGSELSSGANNNSINLNYGGWSIVILPHWVCDRDKVIVMSSEANKVLGGNMFFNRVPLTVSNWIDHHTGNHMWTGRCRFGLGFGSYKHAILAVDSAEEFETTTKLEL